LLVVGFVDISWSGWLFVGLVERAVAILDALEEDLGMTGEKWSVDPIVWNRCCARLNDARFDSCLVIDGIVD